MMSRSRSQGTEVTTVTGAFFDPERISYEINSQCIYEKKNYALNRIENKSSAPTYYFKHDII